MKWLLLTLFILVGCNSETPELGAIQGLRDPSNPIPFITSITTPDAATTFTLGQSITFEVTYSEPVVVTGSPSLRVQTDSGMFQAYFVSSTPTVLTFQYTVAAGQYDVDGIRLVMPVLLNGGNIIEPETGDTALLTFSTMNLPGYLVYSLTPMITSITPPDPGTYAIGSTLTFTTTYNIPVTVTGTPRFLIDAAGGLYYANYVTGSGTTTLTYDLSAPVGRSGNLAISSANTDLNGGTIADAFGVDADNIFPATSLTGRNIDTIEPTISGQLAVPANGTYYNSQPLDFTLTFSEPVEIVGTNPYLTLTLNSGTVIASFLSIAPDNLSIKFRYTVVPGDADPNGIAVATSIGNFSSIEDLAGNALVSGIISVPSTAGVLVAANPPTITSMTNPTASTYILGNTLTFTANFSDVVHVTGSPRITYMVGGTSSVATYAGGTGTNQLTFTYTIPLGRSGTVSIVSGAINLNGGTIRDTYSTDADLTIPGSSFAGILIDSIPPAQSGSATIPANGTYISGQQMDLVVTFSENVQLSGGSPSIELTFDTGTVTATAVSAIGNQVTFRYTVAAGAQDLTGIGISSTITNFAFIKDLAGNPLALNSLSKPSSTGILVDALGPTISNISTSSLLQVYSPSTSNNFAIRVNFSEDITVTGGPLTLDVDIGGTPVTSSACSVLPQYFVCTVNTTANVEDMNGIDVTGINTNGATITDTAGNAADLTYSYPKNISGLKVDTKGPTITGFTYNTAAGTYTAGSISFNVVFNETVVPSGTPRIQIDLDGTTAYANAFTNSGPSVSFRHTITSDLSFSPITHSGVIDLNGGYIKDVYGNNADLSIPTLDLTRYRIIPGGIGHWFDPNSTYTTTTSSGSPTSYTSLTGSGISTTISGTPDFVTRNGARLLKFDPGDTINFGTTSQIYHVIMLVRAPSVNGDAFASPANGIGASWDSNGNVNFGLNCSLACRYYSSNSSASTAPFMNATVFTTVDDDYYYLVFEAGSYNFSGSNLKIGYNNFSGEIGDVFIFTGNTLTDTLRAKIKTYLDNKYGPGIVYPNP